MEEKSSLINKAIEVRSHAYTPYSNFKVGAALLTEQGTIYTGANIENAAYPSSCCAERVAIFSAISNGERNFRKLAVVADAPRPVPPCGTCRQVMSEFFSPEVIIYLSNCSGDEKEVTMEEILPFSFQSTDMNKK